jgi:hypothetical protein
MEDQRLGDSDTVARRQISEAKLATIGDIVTQCNLDRLFDLSQLLQTLD